MRRKRRLLIGTLGLYTLATIIGCTSPVTSLRGIVPDNTFTNNYKTVDELLQHHFTPEAYEELRDIETVDGYVLPSYSGYAVGFNFWSRVGALLTCSGPRKKVVVNEGKLDKNNSARSTLVHEYMHQADALGLIDHDEFNTAYDMVRANDACEQCTSLEETVEKGVEGRSFLFWWFGGSKTSERVALMGEEIGIGEKCPDYMRDVYRNVLK